MKRSYFAFPLALCLVLGVLAFVPAVGNAGIVIGTPTVNLTDGPFATSPPWSFEVKADWIFAAGDSAVSYVGPNWNFTLTPGDFFSFKVLTLSGSHVVNPHGESAAPAFVGGVLFPVVPSANVTAFGNVLHPGSGHNDDWQISAVVNGTGTGATITVQAFHPTPVPEPSSLALLGVGSLIGLGVYTRRRRKNA